MGRSEEPFGGSRRPLGELLGGLYDSEGRLLVIWEDSLVDLGASWSALGASWSALGASWTSLGGLLARSWEHLGGFRRSFLSLKCVFEAIC